MKNFILLTALLLTLLTGCKKEEPTYHRDIFRCKVNGVEWSATCPSDGLFGCNPIDCQYYWKDTKTISLVAIRRLNNNEIYQSMRLYKYKSQDGENQLAFTTREYTDWNKPSGCRFHDLDTTSTRRLTILEVDTVKFLIKGTFEFTGIDHYGECKDTVRITDGYFHVNFRF